MKDLNKMRLMAGLPIDASIEKTIVEQKVVVNNVVEAAGTGKPIEHFYIVGPASHHSELHDILHRTNTKGLFPYLRGFQNKEIDAVVIFADADKEAATQLAYDRIEKAKTVNEGKTAIKDYDGDGKIESPEEEYKGSVDKAIKSKKAAKGEEQEECSKKQQMDESMHYHTDDSYPETHADAKHHAEPITNPSEYDTVFDKPEIEKPEEDYEMANDTTPVTVPANVLKDLKTVIDDCMEQAKKSQAQDQSERRYYYEDTAKALQIVHDYIGWKTVEGLKRAQVYSQRMANVSRHLMPDHVWKFIVDDGQKRSLKDYVLDVKKYPIVGPRDSE